MRGINFQGLVNSNNITIGDLLKISETYPTIPEDRNLHYDPENELTIEFEKSAEEILREIEIENL